MKFFWGLVIAGFGVILLGMNLGWWNVDIWRIIWYLWPLIFIVLGLRFLINDDKLFMIMTLILVLSAGYLLIKTPERILNRIDNLQELKSESVDEGFSKDQTKSVDLKLNLGASKVEIGSLDDRESQEKIYEIETRNYGPLEENRSDKDSKAIVSVSEEFTKGIFRSKVNNRELVAKLSSFLPIDLSIDSGASSLNLDFSKIKLERFRLNAGASNGEVKFGGAVSVLDARVDTGASKMVFSIPKGTALKVVFESDGLNSKNISSELGLSQLDEKSYISSNYQAATSKINLTISAGVSNIELKQY